MKKTRNNSMSNDKCSICNGEIQLPYNPMEEWKIVGVLCGECYSKKLSEFYPGEHVRVNKHLD
jgi:hypothetical protein